ncbi:protein of unknown function (plasmid) [Cupriavidus neocaledonicus]|uniref:Uncharacterized protein n=1 Tax=Cupriavidus neocaledonicus TaxID=1040979 RepID=A0A375HPN6_9BURK|nr:hypothetical protein CBM2605_B130304 [Cupriavidus neocaledonicus]SPD59323.1 protein of unknown function [Cupriavidus neocaledonicus]
MQPVPGRAGTATTGTEHATRILQPVCRARADARRHRQAGVPGHGAAGGRPGHGRRSGAPRARHRARYRLPLLLAARRSGGRGAAHQADRDPAGPGDAWHGRPDAGAALSRQPRHARHPDHRAVDQGRSRDQGRGLCRRRQRLPGQAARQHRADRAHPLPLALVPEPAAARRGLPRAAPEPAAAAGDQPRAAAPDQFGRADRLVQPALFRRIPRRGMAPRAARANPAGAADDRCRRLQGLQRHLWPRRRRRRAAPRRRGNPRQLRARHRPARALWRRRVRHGAAGHLARRRAPAGRKGAARGAGAGHRPQRLARPELRHRQHRRRGAGAPARRAAQPAGAGGRCGPVPGQAQRPQPGHDVDGLSRGGNNRLHICAAGIAGRGRVLPRRRACAGKARRLSRPRRHHLLSESSDTEFGASRLSGLRLQTYRCITASVIPRLHTR